MDEDHCNADVRNHTGEIVTSYLANNSVRSDDLPGLIQTVYDALTNLGQPAAEPLVKPVSIARSIQNNYLISMEDGKQYHTLKRHLSKHGLTPAEYRRKWELPFNYPMTAPGYSQRRSALAKSFGRGKARSTAVIEAEVEPEPVERPKRGSKKAEPAKAA